ncbi:hypothetical protein DU18_0509 [Chlamydia muridarum]|nr:hypothetical protein DU18_0509 [Chlamydia muridarum]
MVLIVLGTVLAAIGACAVAVISGVWSIGLGTLVVGGVLLATGFLFALMEICRAQYGRRQQKIQTQQEVLESSPIREEATLPFIEQAVYSHEPELPLSSQEEVRCHRPIILQRGSKPAETPKFIAVGNSVVELVKVGMIGPMGRRGNVNPGQTLVRLWDELFALGRMGELVRLDGFCCKVLPATLGDTSVSKTSADRASSED